jgi:hypothetical protein
VLVSEAARPPVVPYAGRTVIALDPQQLATIRRTVALLDRVSHSGPYEAAVDEGADDIVRFAPGNAGVMMGYDFHVTPAGPRLIEVNTNAGGALLNGLHTLSLCDPEKLACLCQDLLPVETIRERILRTFVAEFAAVRGAGSRPARIAIADERPREQFLFPEFELFVELFREAGIDAEICDTGELARAGGALRRNGRPVDLVYLRDTDFVLAAPRSAEVRAAYRAGEVVVTPSPREHHLLANKRRLVLFSDSGALARFGVDPEDARFLAEVVPETLPLADLGRERAWRERRDWVFKPCAAFGSRAVYRGDKISRRKLDEIADDPSYLGQRRVEPGVVAVETIDGPRSMKFDVRAYAYRGEVLLLGARVYQGQVTNLRSPGGGFSAICVSRSPEAAS